MTSALLFSCPTAAADDQPPEMGLGQYAHSTWKFDDGFPVTPPITAIAQTPDGYIWLGSHVGLWRFDGVNTIPWPKPAGRPLRDNWINSLHAARDGTLWIGTRTGLVSWRDDQLREYPALDGQDVLALLVDREGTVWAGTESKATSTGRLCAIRGTTVNCYGEDGSLGARIYCLLEDGNGRLWFTSSTGIWNWRAGNPKHYPLLDPVWGYYQSLTSRTDGGLLASTPDGLREFAGDDVRAVPLPVGLPQANPPRVLTDSQGALWLGTFNSGLRYIHSGKEEPYRTSDGLTSDHITRLFEDSESSLWVGTVNGLDEFRKVAVAHVSGVPGLWHDRVSAVLADADGSIWFATPTGLYRRKDGMMTVYRGPAPKGESRPPATSQTLVREITVVGLPRDTSGSLYQDRRGRIWLGLPSGLGYLQDGRFISFPGAPSGTLNCIAEDDTGYLWIADRTHGLLRIAPDGEVKRIAWTELGIAETWRIAFDPVRHGLWLGSTLGDIAFFKDGRIRESYSVSGASKRAVSQLRLDPDGTLWAATEAGLARLRNGHLAILDGKSGLPCDIVQGTVNDAAGSLWLYMDCGLVRIARSDIDAWSDSVGRADFPPHPIRTLVLDSSDGFLNSVGAGSLSPNIAKSGEGRLWFATPDGAMTVDPRNLYLNKFAPPVHIQQITVDQERYSASPALRLPPLVHDIEIDYTALSLVAPLRNQFRYQLVGFDHDWQSVGNRRQAFYNDLPPGEYRFRVVASNNNGVWNDQGATLNFSVAPAYWQTNWFRALCACVFLLILWMLHLVRARQLARQFNLTLDARVNERTRIARELHDTLLQSFHGLLLRFQTAKELLHNRAAEAEQVLDSAIDHAAAAITEGRNAVQGLRSSTRETNDLATAIQAMGQELATHDDSGAISLEIGTKGASRALHPIVRDEVYRIVGEALRNSYRHSGAAQIEVELCYEEHRFRLRVSDDGKGFDQQTLSQGDQGGHFGLQGMRERAKVIGGCLTVWSAVNSGTEIELTVPAKRAYGRISSTRNSATI